MIPVRESLVISNNPAVWNLFPGCKRLTGSPLEIMREARDRVHQGWQLLGHPLMGSIRLIRNPYRSVVLGLDGRGIDGQAILQVEEAYWRLTQTVFDTSTASLSDYQLIDLELLKSLHLPDSG
ncbi:MAG: GrdX family protein [Pseudomonadota bacterium]